MPSLDENKQVWGQTYDWSTQGDEWSAAWGGVSYQWWTTLFPRLQGFVPAQRILEIAPGYGRWTHYLRDLCDEIVIVDISENAIEYCRERFWDDERVIAYVNDGTSLEVVEDESVDLVFSFDSLVHAERDVMRAYLAEIAKKLTSDGVAFIHHSNMANYPTCTFDPENIHWRATSVGSALLQFDAATAGLSCISQEMIAWGNTELLTDCISVITRRGSRWERDNVYVENYTFTSQEIALAARLSKLYPPSLRAVSFSAARR